MNKYNEEIAMLNENSEKVLANKKHEFNLLYILKNQNNELINVKIVKTEDLKILEILKSKYNLIIIDIINHTKTFNKSLSNNVKLYTEVVAFIKNNFNITQITKSFEVYNILFTNYSKYIPMQSKDIITDISISTNIKRNIVANYLARLKYSNKNYRNAKMKDLLMLWLNDYKKYVENK